MRINKKTSILVHLFISYLIFLLPLFLVGSGLGRLTSYLLTLLTSSLAIIYLSFMFRNIFAINITILAMTGFGLKILIGYMFWEFYIWPDYFNQYSNMAFDHYEYLFTQTSILQTATHRLENNFFSPPPLIYALTQGKYIFINYIMSNLYMSGNSNLLDFSIQNSLFSVYTAVVIALISISFGTTKKQTKIIFIISLFQPFSFISTMFWRDVVGQFFAILGIYFLLSSFNSPILRASFLILISSLSMFLLRSVYVIIPIFLYLLKYFKDGVISIRKGSILLVLFALVALILFKTNLVGVLGDGYSSYLSIFGISFILLLPLDYIKALIGPFPWINWLEFNDNTIFHIANYFQAVYVVAILYFTIKFYKSSKSELKFYTSFIFLILLSMSLITKDVHTEYYSFAVAILLPITAKYLTIKRFVFVYSIVFVFFIVLNVVYSLLGLVLG